jgi:Phage integrase family
VLRSTIAGTTSGGSWRGSGTAGVGCSPSGGFRLLTLKANSGAGSAERVFPRQAGGPLNDSNVRNRLLAKAVERANERLEKAKSVPLPEGLTPHKLRHTFASLLVALGTDPGVVIDELGHTDPGFTLRVYRHSMRREQDSREQLTEASGSRSIGTNWHHGADRGSSGASAAQRPRCENGSLAGDSQHGPGWTRTSDLPIMSRQL